MSEFCLVYHSNRKTHSLKLSNFDIRLFTQVLQMSVTYEILDSLIKILNINLYSLTVLLDCVTKI